ncbi:MAG TPA: hypothetical protein DCS75_08935 [Gemmatimonadetes bacterium]|nr:hypothetical protein [Gemmatimonadota bacterium]
MSQRIRAIREVTSRCSDDVGYDLNRDSSVSGWSPMASPALTMHESPSIVPDGIIKGSVCALFRPLRKARFVWEVDAGARIF